MIEAKRFALQPCAQRPLLALGHAVRIIEPPVKIDIRVRVHFAIAIAKKTAYIPVSDNGATHSKPVYEEWDGVSM